MKNQKLISKCNHHIKWSLPQVFHTVYSIKTNLMPSTPLARCHNHQFSHPITSNSYEKLMADSSLLHSFSEDEWMSVHGLPYLCAIHVYVVSERHFTWLTSSALWEKAAVDITTEVGSRSISVEIASLASLVMDGVGEEKLQMITATYRTD